MLNNGLEKFTDLENKVYRAIELFKAVKLQKESLEKEVLKLKAQLEQNQNETERLRQEALDMKRERELVKGKVEAILQNLDNMALWCKTEKRGAMVQFDNSTRIDIFDQNYQLRGVADPAHVQELAAYVDRKMREVADASKTVDSLKVAVMAALNIADELFQERENARRMDAIVYDKSMECSRLLDQVLKR